MSDLQKSKRFDLIDIFNDTSRYLDDIFTIDNPEFEKHIPDFDAVEMKGRKCHLRPFNTDLFLESWYHFASMFKNFSRLSPLVWELLEKI